MSLFEWGCSLGCVFELIMIPVRLLCALVERFKNETVLLIIVGISAALWYCAYEISPFALGIMLLSKKQLNAGSDNYFGIMVVIGLYLLLIAFRKISQWTRAACYGCVTAFAFSAFVGYYNKFYLNDAIPKMIAFVLALVIAVLLMWVGFHKMDNWITIDKDVLGMIVGIIPSLLYSFVTVSTIITFTFGEEVVDKFSYVVLAIVLELVIYGVGIFFRFRFSNKYWEIIMKKAGINVDDYITEERVVSGGESSNKSSTVTETNKVASDVTLSDDVMEQIRKKNKK